MMVRMAATKRSASLCCGAWLSGAAIEFLRIVDRELSGDDMVSRKRLWERVFSSLDALADNEWQTIASASRKALQNLAKRQEAACRREE